MGGTVQESIWRRIYDRALCWYITLISHWAQCPKDVMLEELDLFMREVWMQLSTPEYRAAAE